jgi:transcriptional regulator with XRE-family HTH domain
MEQYNFSLGRLARYADCSKGFISHLLAGRRSSCTPELAARIAEALNVPLEVLFDAKASPTGMSNDKEHAA